MERQIKDFNAELDQVLAGKIEPAGRLLNLAHEYARLDVVIPAKQAELRRHLLRATFSWRRAGVAAVVAAILVAVFWITPLSSFAQEMVTRIGDLLFTGEPTWARSARCRSSPVSPAPRSRKTPSSRNGRML